MHSRTLVPKNLLPEGQPTQRLPSIGEMAGAVLKQVLGVDAASGDWGCMCQAAEPDQADLDYIYNSVRDYIRLDYIYNSVRQNVCTRCSNTLVPHDAATTMIVAPTLILGASPAHHKKLPVA